MIGTVVGGEVISGEIHRLMVVHHLSTATGEISPRPIEIREILKHHHARVVLYRGQNVESLETATPVAGEVGLKVKGVDSKILKPGDMLVS